MTTATTRETGLADLLPPPDVIREQLTRCNDRAALLRKLLRLRLEAEEQGERREREE